MTSDKKTAPDKDPPITEGQLVGLFMKARMRSHPSSMLVDATAANTAVCAALDDVLAELRTAGLDPHTDYQLTHVFDALKSVVKETLSLPRPAETRGSGRHTAKVITEFGEELRERAAHFGKGGGDKPAGLNDPRAAAGTPNTAASVRALPDRTAVAANVLDAVQKALRDVEKAFDRRPPQVSSPPQPWYQNRLLLEHIADLLGEASQQHTEETWIAVDRLKEALRLDEIRVLFYDPEAGAEQQADAFSLEDYAKSPDGRYVTDKPALVKTSANGGRQILIVGEVRRLPAEDME
jgi:hypothetical protein